MYPSLGSSSVIMIVIVDEKNIKNRSRFLLLLGGGILKIIVSLYGKSKDKCNNNQGSLFRKKH